MYKYIHKIYIFFISLCLKKNKTRKPDIITRMKIASDGVMLLFVDS